MGGMNMAAQTQVVKKKSEFAKYAVEDKMILII